MWGLLSGFLDQLADSVGGSLADLFNALRGGAASAADGIVSTLKGWVKDAIAALSDLLDRLHSAVQNAWNGFTAALDFFIDGFGDLFSGLWAALGWLYYQGIPGLLRQINDVLDYAGKVGDNIVQWVKGQIVPLIDGLGSRLDGFIDYVTNTLENTINDAINAVSSNVETLWSYIHGTLDDLDNFAGLLVGHLINWIKNASKDALVAVGTLALQLFLSLITELPDVAEEILANIF